MIFPFLLKLSIIGSVKIRKAIMLINGAYVFSSVVSSYYTYYYHVCKNLQKYLIVFPVLYLTQFGRGLFCFSFLAYLIFLENVLIDP